MQQTVDALWICTPHRSLRMGAFYVCFTHILREASALFARSTVKGNTRASESGTGNSMALTLFCLIHYFQAEGARNYYRT